MRSRMTPPRDRHQNISKRKHQHSESQADAAPKRQKLRHPTVPPPAFWDHLSEVPLCASALRELGRRNTQARKHTHVSPDSTRRRSRRLQTRRAATDDRGRLADQSLRPCSITSLKGVKRLAKHGGPDLTELRGCRAPREMSSSQSSLGRRKRGLQTPVKPDSSNTTTTRSTGPYDRAFQQHLIDHNVLPNRYNYYNGHVPPRPVNLDEIRQVLSRTRRSLSPSQFSDEKFESFLQSDEQATRETIVMSDVIPIIEGNIRDRKCVGSDVLFTNLDHLTDGSLVPGKPDRYHGARPEQLDRNVRKELNHYIVPSTQHDLPIAPTFFLEAKGPGGSLSVATRQACYVGALGARGIHSLQSYKASQPEYDNKAYTLTSIYHGGQLKVYTSHPMQPHTPGGAPGYIMTQAGAYSMTNDINTFRQGAAAYRNGRDWTKERRDEAIKQANEKAGTDEVDGFDLSFASVAPVAYRATFAIKINMQESMSAT